MASADFRHYDVSRRLCSTNRRCVSFVDQFVFAFWTAIADDVETDSVVGDIESAHRYR